MLNCFAKPPVRRSAAVSGLVFGLMMLTAAPASASSTFYLDSHNATDAPGPSFCSGASMLTTTPPGCGSSVTAPEVLASGAVYTVNVLGAVSSWGAWPSPRCGKPEPSSEFGSPGRPNNPVGDDAQFRFAIPLYKGKCPKLAKKTQYFQVDLGGGWFHPIANGDPSKPSPDTAKTGKQDPYTFTFTGQGVAPQFRYVDYYPSDNSGQFKISVTP